MRSRWLHVTPSQMRNTMVMASRIAKATPKALRCDDSRKEEDEPKHESPQQEEPEHDVLLECLRFCLPRVQVAVAAFQAFSAIVVHLADYSRPMLRRDLVRPYIGHTKGRQAIHGTQATAAQPEPAIALTCRCACSRSCQCACPTRSEPATGGSTGRRGRAETALVGEGVRTTTRRAPSTRGVGAAPDNPPDPHRGRPTVPLRPRTDLGRRRTSGELGRGSFAGTTSGPAPHKRLRMRLQT